MKAQREIASFVLRFTQEFWQDTDGEPRIEWRGQVRRVQDGKELCFREIVEALAFMQDSLLKVTKSCLPKADKEFQEKAINESCKYWDKLATDFPTPALATFHQATSAAENKQKFVNEPARAARQSLTVPATAAKLIPSVPASTGNSLPDQIQLLQTCSALQSQVEALTLKVQILEQALTDQQVTTH